MSTFSSSARSSGKLPVLKRLKSWPGKLAKLWPWGRRKPSLAAQLLLPGASKPRSHSQQKQRRRDLSGQAKQLLADGKPAAAIRLLTQALLEDPNHKRYHELLSEAATLRRIRRNKRKADPLAELHREIRPMAFQLDAFSAYVEELEQLLDKAGVPPLAAGKGKSRKSTSKHSASS